MEGKMKYVLDRIEGQHAVLECEDGKNLVVLRSSLPPTAKEGDIIKYVNSTYFIDIEETNESKNKINEKMKKLIKK